MEVGDLHPFPFDPEEWIEIKLIKCPAPDEVPYYNIFKYTGNGYIEPTCRRLCTNPKSGQKLPYQISFDDWLRYVKLMQFEVKQKPKQGHYK